MGQPRRHVELSFSKKLADRPGFGEDFAGNPPALAFAQRLGQLSGEVARDLFGQLFLLALALSLVLILRGLCDPVP
jgi:hypothetical protein